MPSFSLRPWGDTVYGRQTDAEDVKPKDIVDEAVESEAVFPNMPLANKEKVHKCNR